MIKANRPVSNLEPPAVVRKPMKGGGGVNQNYRLTPPEAKVQNAQDAHKDAMSDGDYGDALKRAAAGDYF